MFQKILATTAISLCLGGVAFADTLNLASTPGGSDSNTATTITFVNPGSSSPDTGIFAGLNCTSCVTMSNFTSASTNFQVASIVSGGLTDIITLTSVAFQTVGSSLLITGGGTSVINGGPAALVSFLLTTQVGSGTSYSVSVNTVPVPGALPLFASGLLGFWAWRRKRKGQSDQSLEAAAA